MADSRVLPLKAAAKELGYSVHGLRRLCVRGEIKGAFKIHKGGAWRIRIQFGEQVLRIK